MMAKPIPHCSQMLYKNNAHHLAETKVTKPTAAPPFLLEAEIDGLPSTALCLFNRVPHVSLWKPIRQQVKNSTAQQVFIRVAPKGAARHAPKRGPSVLHRVSSSTPAVHPVVVVLGREAQMPRQDESQTRAPASAAVENQLRLAICHASCCCGELLLVGLLEIQL